MLSKFLLGDNGFNHKEMAGILVSFANREGGTLIVGVTDEGDFEGKGIFDAFSEGSKSGFDKFKEHIENLCKDLISPQLLVEIQHMTFNESDIAVIRIPRRRSIPHAVVAKHEGYAVRSRDYFIRNNHGRALVNDRQLEWLFQYVESPVLETKHEIAITLSKELTHVPKRIEPYAFEVQPPIVEAIMPYLEVLSTLDRGALMDNPETLQRFVGEILTYAIIQTQKGNYDKLKALPMPGEKTLMGCYLGERVKPIIRKQKNLWPVPYGTSMKVKGHADWMLFKFGNRLVVSSMMVKPNYIKDGLSRLNPLNVDGDYITLGYTVSIQTTLKFPESEEDRVDEARAFSMALSEHIDGQWDIHHHYAQIPHMLLLYDMDAKLERLIRKLES